MNYHNITKDDMLNGSGLRVILWIAGCDHKCLECHNPQTWDINGGINFDENARKELFKELSKDHISGITFSGGDPLNDNNVKVVYELCKEIKEKYPTKTIWIYTGYLWERLQEKIKGFYFNPITKAIESYPQNYRCDVLRFVDVLVDGKFEKSLKNNDYHWAGSTNQRVIDVQESLNQGEIVLYE